MANNLSSNTTEDLARVFLEGFEASRVVTKTVDTQLLSGRYTNRTGGTVSVKRPHDYNTIRTSGGDISSSTKSDIIAGKATGVVQDYFTVATEWTNIQEALDLDQLDQILKPMARRMVNDLETSLAGYMRKNAGLKYGTHGTAVDAWGDVAGAMATMQAVGVPMDKECYYVMDPFTTTALANTQSGLASGDNRLVNTAWERAMVSDKVAGLLALTSNALTSYTSGAGADRVGALASAPDTTYVTHKDTMVQTLDVENLQANLEIKAGEVVQITGRNRLNVATREVILDGTTPVVWTATVVEDATANSSGVVSLDVSCPAIYEANGQYNNVDSAPDTGDVVTILGAASTTYSPNLFYHPQAFGMATIELPRLNGWDTVATTEDGISIRVTRYSDGDANKQMVRFDMLPAFIVFNPAFAGLGFGKA